MTDAQKATLAVVVREWGTLASVKMLGNGAIALANIAHQPEIILPDGTRRVVDAA